MSKKHKKTKYQTYGKRKIHKNKKQAGKILMSSAVASTLVFQPFIPVIQNGQVVGFTENYADAATLAEVGLLESTDITAQLNEAPTNTEPHNVSLSLTGTGLADVEVAGPNQVAVFYIPDLAGQITQNGPATVQVDVAPINLQEDLPALYDTVGTLTNAITGLVTGLTTTLDGAINNTLLEGVVGVEGLPELNAALDNLNNLDNALDNLLTYNGQAEVAINPDGSIVVNFSEGLGQNLETAIQEVVTNTVTGVLDAVDGIEINLLSGLPLLGPLLNEIVLGPIVNPLLSAVTNAAIPLTENLTEGVLDLTNFLASAQVIGNTQIDLNVLVNNDPGVAGEIPVYGSVVSTNVIDAQLLSDLTAADTITVPEQVDAEAPAAPVVDPVDTAATEVTGTAEPNSTITVALPGGVEPATGRTDGEGNFVVALPADAELAAGDVLTVTATDAAGNESDPTDVTVTEAVDAEAPTAPVVDPVDTAATEVTGTAEPNSTITVALPGGVEPATGTTNGEGNFVVALPADAELAAGDVLTVTATDAAGNESQPATVTVTEAPDLIAPEITAIEDAIALENEPIENIAVEVNETSDIATEGLPTGLAYDELVGAITGTPVVDDWIADEEERTFNVTVTATDEAGNASEEDFTLTIQRDTDGDGIPDIEDEDDDGDGATDEEEDEAGTDPKDETDVPDLTAPEITEIANTSVLENAPIEDIVVEVSEPSEVVAEGLPTGLDYDAENQVITGTPVVEDWGLVEEERGFEVVLTATDEAGNTSEAEEFILIVQRDTDGDGIPDVEDEDDDNDGATDEEEDEAGTDPKDDTDTPGEDTPVDPEAPVITPIANTFVLENQAIEPIDVLVEGANEVTTAGLPTGLSYDAESSIITGTPVVDDWRISEEQRGSLVTVTATDEDGDTSVETFALIVQRDTDGDGIPDVEDDDDDNDGFTDEEENEAGTDPKDDTDVPDVIAPEITAIEDAVALENTPIENIAVEVNEASDIDTEGLPIGLAYDELVGAITGTPVVDDWIADEEERTFNVTVTATDEAGNASEEDFALTIQRDTDGDGIPDVEDEDDDNDGVSDEDETEAGTDPKDDTDVPDVVAPEAPVVEELTSEDTEIVGTAEPGSEITVTLPNDTTVAGTTNEDGEFAIELPEEPVLTGWETIEVVATDEAGNASEPTIITVADRTPPLVLDIEDQTVVEGSPIEDIDVAVENPGEVQSAPAAQFSTFALVRPFAAPLSGVYSSNLPEGVTFDPSTNVISGTPVVSDWELTEEERDFEVTVTARDEAGNEAATTFTITVQRDTDGDGIPDVTDTDDDNDGVSDEDEIAAGTDPKDETDTPELTDTVAPTITPIDDVTVVENTPIADITVEVDEPSLLIATGLPSGIAFDEETGVISGAPVIDDWGSEEEERTFNATITARDAAGNESEETLAFTVQRDTDGDGTPDVTDTDDDNDGATDAEENEAGTDPKDPSDTPAEEAPSEDTEAPVITPIPDISAEENQPIEDVTVEVNEPSDVVVDGLPSGLTYDPETGVISGTPVIDDWAEGETERTYDVTITAEDEAGNVSTTELSITITRALAEDDNGTGTPGAGDSDVDNDGTAGDGDDAAGDGQDGEFSDANDQEKLPQTGETQNIWKAFSGSVMAAVSAFMLAWNKKKNAFTKKK